MMRPTMTPCKPTLGGRRFSGPTSALNFDDDSLMDQSEASVEVESPPSPSRSTSRTKNRLFDDDDEGDNVARLPSKTPAKRSSANGNTSILKPLDLNLSLDEEEENDNTTTNNDNLINRASASASHPASQQEMQRRIRLQKMAESGKRDSFGSNNSHLSLTPTRSGQSNTDTADMVASPYVSPSTYMTMDGRCVTSKNPFSPMITETEVTPRGSASSNNYPNGNKMATHGTAPSFPMSFDTYGAAGADNNKTDASNIAPPACRHRLQKRDANWASSPSKRSFFCSAFTRDGYPERTGRYSFTGSPIHEHATESSTMMDMDSAQTTSSSPAHTTATKIRRLTLKDDVTAAAGHQAFYRQQQQEVAPPQPPPLANLYGRRAFGGQLTVIDTSHPSEVSSVASFEEVSPTDIMSFPAPPTPTKTKKSTSPYSSITPKPPTTPFLSRSGRRTRQSRRGSGGSGTSMSLGGGESDADGEAFRHGNGGAAMAAAPTSRFNADFDVISELGKGSFGAVFKVMSRLDGCMYAVKKIGRKPKGNADRDRMLKEVYALAALSDQADPATFHIVRYHNAFWDEGGLLYIQCELCTSTLESERRSLIGPMPEERRYKLLREMLLALEFLHRNGMVHLDIKPENIFQKNGLFKLGDFGLVVSTSDIKNIEEGDSRYMSMELLSGEHQDLTKSDIFSLGATLYEISLLRPLPMNGPEWQAIRSGALHPLPHTTYDMAMLIMEMMNPNYVSRPSASELLKREQLLSEDQKALIAAKSKAFQANMALARHTQQFKPPVPAAGGLVRRNTWSGGNM